MTKMIARLGDQVDMCCPHAGIGTIITASSNVKCNGKFVARHGDQVRCNKCGIIRFIDYDTTSPNVHINDIRLARWDDTSTGICDPGECGDCPHTTVAHIIEGSEQAHAND